MNNNLRNTLRKKRLISERLIDATIALDSRDLTAARGYIIEAQKELSR